MMSACTGASSRIRYLPKALSQRPRVAAANRNRTTANRNHRKRPFTPKLLVLGLLFEASHRFQLLKHPLHFGFVVGQQQWGTRGRQLLLRWNGRRRLAPKLAIWHAVDERFAGIAAQVLQQAAGGILIARIDYQDAGL